MRCYRSTGGTAFFVLLAYFHLIAIISSYEQFYRMQGLEAWALWALIVKAALAVIYVAMIIFPFGGFMLASVFFNGFSVYEAFVKNKVLDNITAAISGADLFVGLLLLLPIHHKLSEATPLYEASAVTSPV